MSEEEAREMCKQVAEFLHSYRFFVEVMDMDGYPWGKGYVEKEGEEYKVEGKRLPLVFVRTDIHFGMGQVILFLDEEI